MDGTTDGVIALSPPAKMSSLAFEIDTPMPIFPDSAGCAMAGADPNNATTTSSEESRIWVRLPLALGS
jgi:hypothetical protein